MQNPFVIVAHVPTDSVIKGFIPELKRRNQPLLLVTDQPERHQCHLESGLIKAEEIVAADVFNPIAILNVLTQYQITPAAVLTNSDHLQTAAAMVAAFYGLPAKDWQACYRAKNKLVMRQTIQDAGLDNVWFRPVYQREELQASDIPFPCIVKPVEGVASENVALVSNVQELQQHADRFWQKVPGQPLLLEEYLEGSLHTLETLGDGQQIQVMGSFETFLSEPPCFIELEQRFSREPAHGVSEVLLAQLKALGVGFGTCHTEFVMTDKGPRLIEVNYRNIGDQSDFLMAQALGFNLFGAVIDLYMGHAAAELPSGSQSAYIYCQVAEQSGIIRQVPVAQQLEKEGCQISFEPLCKAGDFHQQDFSNRDYLSILRATGPSEQVLMPVVQHFIQELKIQFTTDLSDTALNAEEAVA